MPRSALVALRAISFTGLLVLLCNPSLVTAAPVSSLARSTGTKSLLDPWASDSIPPLWSNGLNQDPDSDMFVRNTYFNQAQSQSKVLKKAAAKSPSSLTNNNDYQEQCSSALTNYNAAIRNLNRLTADKGLAFYDKNNDLETLLKHIINLHKGILESIHAISSFVPGLEPIVYELKCLIDDFVLNVSENLADALLNSIQPSLVALSLQAKTVSCIFGVPSTLG